MLKLVKCQICKSEINGKTAYWRSKVVCKRCYGLRKRNLNDKEIKEILKYYVD